MELSHVLPVALLVLGIWLLWRSHTDPGGEEPEGGGGVRRHPHARDPAPRPPHPRRRGPHGGADRTPAHRVDRIRSVTARGRAFQHH